MRFARSATGPTEVVAAATRADLEAVTSVGGLIEILRRPGVTSLFVRTEPHGRFDDIRDECSERIDIFDFHGLGRIRGAARILRTFVPPPVDVVVIDATEGWLAVSASMRARRLSPDSAQVGLQHGLFPLPDGRLGRDGLRRLRSFIDVGFEKTAGVTPFGPGFGNRPFELYICYGERYADHIRGAAAGSVVVDFAGLTGVYPSGQADVRIGEILVVAQGLLRMGATEVERDAIYRAVLGRLVEISDDLGLALAFRNHPKFPVPMRPETVDWNRFTDRTDDDEHELIEKSGTLFVSFNSSLLLKAHAAGRRIVVVDPGGLAPGLFDMFSSVVPLEDFTSSWTPDSWSTVKAGIIG